MIVIIFSTLKPITLFQLWKLVVQRRGLKSTLKNNVETTLYAGWDDRQMRDNKLCVEKIRFAVEGSHNLLPVIWRPYFNQFTKLNTHFFIMSKNVELTHGHFR